MKLFFRFLIIAFITTFVVTVIDAQPPVADFTADQDTICAGDTVNYTDLSTGAPTSWAWTFPGGTPASSSDQNPSIAYNTAGTYDVTLEATNGSGSDTEIKIAYITVNSNPVLSTSITNVTCNGGSDGAIDLTVANNPGKKSYTPTSTWNSFFDRPPVQDLTYINDGNLGCPNDGTFWGPWSPNPFEMTMTFAVPVILDSVRVMAGQFNCGTGHPPNRMELYRGTSGGTLLRVIEPPTFTLDTYSFVNTVADTIYTWVIFSSTSCCGYAALMEIECYGTTSGSYTYSWTGGRLKNEFQVEVGV